MKVRVEICGLDTSTLPKLDLSTSEALMKRLKGGDETARNEYVMANMRLVLSVIQRFWGKKDNIDDIFQVGCVGLIKAIDNFKTEFNVRFSTYAVPMIVGEIKRYLRDNNSLKVTRSIRDIAYKALQAKEKLEILKNRDVSTAEIAEEIGEKEFAVICAFEAISDPMSLYEPVFNQAGDTIMLLDQVSDKRTTEAKWAEDVTLKVAQELLSVKEKDILFMRYYEGKTQVEVSKEVGISQAQVSRLEKTALKRMKENI